MEEETAYSLLNVSKDASSKEILNSYRLLALKFHPKNYSAGDTFIHVHFRKLAEAYTTLIDPHKRREYDRSLGLNSSGNPRKPSFTNDPQLSKISRHEALLSRPRRNSYAGTELGSSNLLNSLDPRGLIPENVAKSHDFAGPDHDMARSDRVSKIPETNQSCFNSGFGRQLPSQTIQERPRRHSTVLNQPSLQLPSRSENFGNLISRPTSSYSNQIPSLIRPLPNRGPQSIQSQQTRPNIIRPGSCGPNLSQSSGTNSQNNSSGNMPFRAISISKTILIDADGSYHLEKVQKQRTFDESGTIRESYRRQKAGGQMDNGREGLGRRSENKATLSRSLNSSSTTRSQSSMSNSSPPTSSSYYISPISNFPKNPISRRTMNCEGGDDEEEKRFGMRSLSSSLPITNNSNNNKAYHQHRMHYKKDERGSEKFDTDFDNENGFYQPLSIEKRAININYPGTTTSLSQSNLTKIYNRNSNSITGSKNYCVGNGVSRESRFRSNSFSS